MGGQDTRAVKNTFNGRVCVWGGGGGGIVLRAANRGDRWVERIIQIIFASLKNLYELLAILIFHTEDVCVISL